MAAVAAAALTLASLLGVGAALNFDLPPGQEECFYEEVHAGMLGRGAGGGVWSVGDGGRARTGVVAASLQEAERLTLGELSVLFMGW